MGISLQFDGVDSTSMQSADVKNVLRLTLARILRVDPSAILRIIVSDASYQTSNINTVLARVPVRGHLRDRALSVSLAAQIEIILDLKLTGKLRGATDEAAIAETSTKLIQSMANGAMLQELKTQSASLASQSGVVDFVTFLSSADPTNFRADLVVAVDKNPTQLPTPQPSQMPTVELSSNQAILTAGYIAIALLAGLTVVGVYFRMRHAKGKVHPATLNTSPVPSEAFSAPKTFPVSEEVLVASVVVPSKALKAASVVPVTPPSTMQKVWPVLTASMNLDVSSTDSDDSDADSDTDSSSDAHLAVSDSDSNASLDSRSEHSEIEGRAPSMVRSISSSSDEGSTSS